MFALIDPNWGEGDIVITSTIRKTQEEAWEAALTCREVSIYSGYSEYPLPAGTKGQRAPLERQGFKVKPIKIEVLG